MDLDLGWCQAYNGLKYHIEDAYLEQGLNANNASDRPPLAIFAKKYCNEIDNLDHIKKHDYCFIGSLKTCIERRKWVIDFAKKYFTSNSIFINTDSDKDYEIIGTFDKSKQNLGYNPKEKPNNQSRDVQYRKVEENLFYFQTLCKSKFILCPAGDSTWSFRFYETLMCHSIPIVESWHHTYRTREEATIPYKYVMYNTIESINDKMCDEIVNINTLLFKKYHLLNDATIISKGGKININKDDQYYFITSDSGLGDRLGQIVTICTYAKIFNLTKKIIILWHNSSYHNYNFDIIKNYFTFPKNCQITDNKSTVAFYKPLYLFNNIRKWDHGFDLVPESAFILLSENYRWQPEDCNMNNQMFVDIHNSISHEIKIDKKILKGNIFTSEKYKCLHIRRTDKKIDQEQPFIPNNLLEQMKNDTYFIVSDDIIPETVKPSNCNVYTIENLNAVEKVILDLYVLVNATEIISVIYSDGWSSFSYMSSRIAGTKLISFVPQNSRYSAISKFVGLSNLSMWNIEHI